MSEVCDEAAIRALLHHAGRMVMWQAVERWDAQQILCRTLTHCDALHPLRGDDGLSSIHLAEYGAQLMALHGALLAQQSGQRLAPGVLTSLRDFEMAQPYIDHVAAPLLGHAQSLLSGASGSIYQFEITAAGQWLARGRVSVMTPAGI